MDNNLKKSIERAMNKSSSMPAFDTTQQKENQELQNQLKLTDEFLTTQKESSYESGDAQDVQKQNRNKWDKPLKIFGGLCLALSLTLLVFFSPSTSINTTEAAKNALKNKSSISLAAGTILLLEDEDIGKQDYTITHKNDQSDTKIWVWDYAAEDGDYVQVLVNGVPISEPFMIKHKPVEITVPAVGKVQIKGIRDGGGGITYAVRYDLNGRTYFNSAPEGEFNTYTLVKE